MKSLVLSIFLMTACASKNQVVVKNFETTNSMCLDALFVNMTGEGCDQIIHENMGSYVKMSCSQKNLGRWTEHEYYLFQTGTILERDDVTKPLCTDMNISVTFSKISQ